MSKPKCLIHAPGNFSDECKFLGDFGFKYVKIIPTKYRERDPVPRKTFNTQQENNYIVNNAVDEILLQENQKVSAEKESHENIESDFD